MTANRRSAQWPLGLVDTNGNRLNQARVIVKPKESHSRSFDQRLRARAPFTARNRRFVDLYGALPVKRLFLGSAASSLFGAGKAVLRPVACDQVPGARGRGQGTETLAKLGGFAA